MDVDVSRPLMLPTFWRAMFLLADVFTRDHSTPERYELRQDAAKKHGCQSYRLGTFNERLRAGSAKLRHHSPELLDCASGEILTALARNPPSFYALPNHNFTSSTRSLGECSHVAASEWWLHSSWKCRASDVTHRSGIYRSD